MIISNTDKERIGGGGPAAWELTRLGHQPVVLEKADVVGGLARTEVYRGYRF